MDWLHVVEQPTTNINMGKLASFSLNERNHTSRVLANDARQLKVSLGILSRSRAHFCTAFFRQDCQNGWRKLVPLCWRQGHCRIPEIAALVEEMNDLKEVASLSPGRRNLDTPGVSGWMKLAKYILWNVEERWRDRGGTLVWRGRRTLTEPQTHFCFSEPHFAALSAQFVCVR